jgi:conjugal transfer mating pair stabilization protein TraG
MTVNVITSGGGQYIVNVLNAVAAWTGGGGFRSLLQVVMVMGLGYSLLVMAFSLNGGCCSTGSSRPPPCTCA